MSPSHLTILKVVPSLSYKEKRRRFSFPEKRRREMSPKRPCNESQADMAKLVEEVLTQQNPGWSVYPYGAGGYHVQLIPDLLDAVKLTAIRISLKFWGFTRGPSEEVESWFYPREWRNPCQK